MTPLESYRRLIEKISNRDTYGLVLVFKHEGQPIKYIRDVLPWGTKRKVTIEVEYRDWDVLAEWHS